MASVKVQAGHKKLLGHLEVQSPVKGRSVTVVCASAILFILLLAALTFLKFRLSGTLIANEGQVSRDGDTQSYTRAPTCGYMLMVPKNESRYVEYSYPSTPNEKGNRCAFPVFSVTKTVRISFANYSFQPSSNAGVIVAEISDDGSNVLKYSKLDYSRDLIAKVPSVIHYTSDGDEKQSSFVIEVSPIESSGSSTGIPETASMLPYEKTGSITKHYPWAAPYPMGYLAVFEAARTSQPGRHFTCSPRNSTCCNSISLYQLPTVNPGGTVSRLTELSTDGARLSSEVTILMIFCLPNNYDASATGTRCLLEWHAINETTKEVAISY